MGTEVSEDRVQQITIRIDAVSGRLIAVVDGREEEVVAGREPSLGFWEWMMGPPADTIGNYLDLDDPEEP